MDKNTFYKIGYGLYVIGAKHGDKFNGFISNTVFQVTATPAQFALGCNKDNLSAEYIRSGKAFSICILSQEADMSLIGTFGYNSGRDIAKYEGLSYDVGETGAPILRDSVIGAIECRLINEYDVGTHILFIGEAVHSVTFHDGMLPLSYSYYRDVKKGTVPKNAPTFQAPSAVAADTYTCPICNYTYDPSKGDDKGGIAAGMSFDDLPDDWVCPICGTEKKFFVK